MSKIELISFTDKEDNYELMHKWCSQEIVYKWFEQRILSKDEIRNKYKNKLLKKDQDLFFIKYDEVKIGFVQIYKYNNQKYTELNKYDCIFEYDIFIGETNYLYKGIGTQVVSYINDYIYEKYACDCIVLRPFKKNIIAIKCYQNNGFYIFDEYSDVDTVGKEEKIVLMINRKENRSDKGEINQKITN